MRQLTVHVITMVTTPSPPSPPPPPHSHRSSSCSWRLDPPYSRAVTLQVHVLRNDARCYSTNRLKIFRGPSADPRLLDFAAFCGRRFPVTLRLSYSPVHVLVSYGSRTVPQYYKFHVYFEGEQLGWCVCVLVGDPPGTTQRGSGVQNCLHQFTISHTEIIIIIIIIIIIVSFKGAIRDLLQSPHSAANCLQHVRSSGPGAVVCKSRATHRALITCKCHVTCHLVRRESSAIKFDRLEIAFI